VGVLHAFTGQNAFFGQNAQMACKAAAQEINAAGGAWGHNISCSVYDTKGDPADAVPVATRMVASAPNLSMVMGPDGNDIPAVLPLLEQQKIPEMNTVGDPRYDKQTSQYFWRLTPSDSTQAPALAQYALSKGYNKVAEVFTSDQSAQTTTQPFEAAYKAGGGTVVTKLNMAPDQASYQTEVSKVVKAHPQAIVGELDPRTAATFFSEFLQQNGSMIPFVATQRTVQYDWAPAVAPAIGPQNVAKYVEAIAPDFGTQGPAFEAYMNAVKSSGGDQGAANNPFVSSQYDGVVAFSLAMDLAHSTSPSAYIAQIANVTSPKSGAVVVHNYANGLKAIEAGKQIQYIGASGKMIFDKYNTATRAYALWTYDPATKAWKMVQILPNS
jgi:ABC-type branched-subunit amino acid transport system substrate-binding protein